jgi:hypothetical protein
MNDELRAKDATPRMRVRAPSSNYQDVRAVFELCAHLESTAGSGKSLVVDSTYPRSRPVRNPPGIPAAIPGGSSYLTSAAGSSNSPKRLTPALDKNDNHKHPVGRVTTRTACAYARSGNVVRLHCSGNVNGPQLQ